MLMDENGFINGFRNIAKVATTLHVAVRCKINMRFRLFYMKFIKINEEKVNCVGITK